MRKYRKVRVLKYRKVLKQFCANFKWAKSWISGPEIVPPVLGQFPVQNTGNPYYLASLPGAYIFFGGGDPPPPLYLKTFFLFHYCMHAMLTPPPRMHVMSPLKKILWRHWNQQINSKINLVSKTQILKPHIIPVVVFDNCCCERAWS